MEFDQNIWYFFAFFGFVATSLVIWAVKHFLPNPKNFFLKHVVYPRFLPWLFRTGRGITTSQALIFLCFLTCNVLLILIPIYPLPEWNLIQKRVALASIVNLAPLCMGGRAPIVDALNISRQSYYFAHASIGAIAAIEAVIHSIISLFYKQGSNQHTLLTSGWISFGLILGASCMPIPISKRILGRWFLWNHRVIAMGAIGVLFWHVLQVTSIISRILVGASCGFWLFTTIFRILKVLYSGRSGTILQLYGDADALQLTIRLTRPIKLQPGCYFYLFFPAFWFKYDIFQSCTAMAFWCPPEDACGEVTEITFLLSRRGNHGNAISRLKEGQTVLLDGPYGMDYGLQKYETVILAVKGMGIAATLPLALGLAARQHYDERVRDKLQELGSKGKAIVKQQAASMTEKDLKTLEQNKMDLAKERREFSSKKLHRDSIKKIVLFWSLESNEQLSLAQQQLKALQALDPRNELLVVWCGLARRQAGFVPFKESDFWRCLNPNPNRPFDNMIVNKITAERSRLSGNLAVIVSGDEEFRAIIRSGIVESIDDKSIHLMETEFQPRGSRQVLATAAYSGPNTKAKSTVKMEQKKAFRESKGSLYSTLSESGLYSIEV
ncbi:hypothetical protein ACQKWADRAFT_307016 [Trichoderma austrokoningii]